MGIVPSVPSCDCVSLCVRAGVPGAVTNGQITCVAREMVMRRQVSESSDAGSPTSS